MTEDNTLDWKLAADAEVAAQLGRLTIDNAALRAQGRAQAADLVNTLSVLSEARGKLAKAEEELTAAKAELALLKEAKPGIAIPS